jgi:membrane-associated protein
VLAAISATVLAIGIDPQGLIESVGLLGLWAVIFAESGILLGFFLPGDSLLFAPGLLTTGVVLRDGQDPFTLAGGHVWLVALGCAVAAVAGDQVGYAFGKRMGPSLMKREQSRFLKPEYFLKAEVFFARHGAKAIVLARFVPIVRTFCPVIAGTSSMHYRTFVKFNVVGGVVWSVGFVLLGYFLGSAFPSIGDNLEIAIVIIVAFSLVPIAFEVLRHRRSRSVEVDGH